MRVRANQIGTYPKSVRREVGEEFEIHDGMRLPLWCDPVDPTVQRPPRKRDQSILYGNPQSPSREKLLARVKATPPVTTLSAMARGEASTALAAANEEIAKLKAQLAAATKAAPPPSVEDLTQ